ncbi:hypothetical protein ACS126_10775 [Sphingobacterium lactis]|uniref:hypothetical protein n=1 Tax=Sphingobacterium lactis TaxID=797291 RepID=UPI003EC75CDC
MNHVVYFFLLFMVGYSLTSVAQPTSFHKLQSLGVSAKVGFDSNFQGLLTGANLSYEHRSNKWLGITSSLNHEIYRGFPFWQVNGSENDWMFRKASFDFGLRAYLQPLYLSASIGLGYSSGYAKEEDNKINSHALQLMGYNSLGLGFQFRKRNGDAMEIEIGINSLYPTKVPTLGYRYRFLLKD